MSYSFIRVLSLVHLSLLAVAAPVTVENRAACSDVMVVFARGTTESPPIGTVAGPPLEAALKTQLGSQSLSFAGVDYPASIPGFLEGGDPTGSTTMASDLTNAANSCPNAKIVSVGYSQGGQLVHNSAKQLSANVASRINAVVIFGDPDNGQAVSGISSDKVKVICHTGDNICAGGDLILPPHLTYGEDATSAAQFIVSKL